MAFFMIFGSSDAPLVGYRNLSASKLSTSFNMQTAIVRSYFYHGVKVIQCIVLIWCTIYKTGSSDPVCWWRTSDTCDANSCWLRHHTSPIRCLQDCATFQRVSHSSSVFLQYGKSMVAWTTNSQAGNCVYLFACIITCVLPMTPYLSVCNSCFVP